MTDAETKLAAFWAETEAPARDLVFELGVDQAIARRRMLVDGAISVVAVAMLAGVLTAVGPDLLAGARGFVTSLAAAGPALAAVAAIGGAMLWLGREPEEA
ncbi:MAG TPA: hypothetical protein VN805_03630 [Caulobacteraceae bacterium]|nr:hypothetical protein [Caulobacteraceae bacterium]